MKNFFKNLLWCLLIPIWIGASFWLATIITNWFMGNESLIPIFGWDFPSLNWIDGKINSDVISNIFSVLFTVLAGAGSIMISILIYSKNQREKDMEDFNGLEPMSVEKFVLDNIVANKMIDEIDEKDKNKKYFFGRDHFVAEFLLLDKYKGLKQFAYDISKQDEDSPTFRKDKPTLFVLLNKGNTKLVPKYVTILYRTRDLGGKNDNHEQYTKTIVPNRAKKGEFYYIEEPLEDMGICDPNYSAIFISPTTKKEEANHEERNNDGKKIIEKHKNISSTVKTFLEKKGMIEKHKELQNTAQHYEDFYRTIKEKKEFVIIVEYKPNLYATIKRKRAYIVNLGVNENRLFIRSIIPLLNKKNIQIKLESSLAKKIDSV